MSDLSTYLEQIKTEANSKLVNSNIKKDVTILNITGTIPPSIDTSDATATASDILKDKVAYVNSKRIVGNIPVADKYEKTITEVPTANNYSFNINSDLGETKIGVKTADIKFPKTVMQSYLRNLGIDESKIFPTFECFDIRGQLTADATAQNNSFYKVSSGSNQPKLYARGELLTTDIKEGYELKSTDYEIENVTINTDNSVDIQFKCLEGIANRNNSGVYLAVDDTNPWSSFEPNLIGENLCVNYTIFGVVGKLDGYTDEQLYQNVENSEGKDIIRFMYPSIYAPINAEKVLKRNEKSAVVIHFFIDDLFFERQNSSDETGKLKFKFHWYRNPDYEFLSNLFTLRIGCRQSDDMGWYPMSIPLNISEVSGSGTFETDLKSEYLNEVKKFHISYPSTVSYVSQLEDVKFIYVDEGTNSNFYEFTVKTAELRDASGGYSNSEYPLNATFTEFSVEVKAVMTPVQNTTLKSYTIEFLSAEDEVITSITVPDANMTITDRPSSKYYSNLFTANTNVKYDYTKICKYRITNVVYE